MPRRRRRSIPSVPPVEPFRAPDPFPTTEDITALAQQMLVSHGRNGTSGIRAYWRAAETELLDQAARRVLAVEPPSTPPA